MDEKLFEILMALIPVCGLIITGIVVPYLKVSYGEKTLEYVSKWVMKAVQAAEVLFDAPKSGEEKRQYVVDFIDKMFNTKKEVITKDQIRMLLEAAWKEMTGGKSNTEGKSE